MQGEEKHRQLFFLKQLAAQLLTHGCLRFGASVSMSHERQAAGEAPRTTAWWDGSFLAAWQGAFSLGWLPHVASLLSDFKSQGLKIEGCSGEGLEQAQRVWGGIFTSLRIFKLCEPWGKSGGVSWCAGRGTEREVTNTEREPGIAQLRQRSLRGWGCLTLPPPKGSSGIRPAARSNHGSWVRGLSLARAVTVGGSPACGRPRRQREQGRGERAGRVGPSRPGGAACGLGLREAGCPGEGAGMCRHTQPLAGGRGARRRRRRRAERHTRQLSPQPRASPAPPPPPPPRRAWPPLAAEPRDSPTSSRVAEVSAPGRRAGPAARPPPPGEGGAAEPGWCEGPRPERGSSGASATPPGASRGCGGIWRGRGAAGGADGAGRAEPRRRGISRRILPCPGSPGPGDWGRALVLRLSPVASGGSRSPARVELPPGGPECPRALEGVREERVGASVRPKARPADVPMGSGRPPGCGHRRQQPEVWSSKGQQWGASGSELCTDAW